MISKEEMYEFASQIAGITDADLEAYKCGGKAKKPKKMQHGQSIKSAGDGTLFEKVKNAGKQVANEVKHPRNYVPKSGGQAGSRMHGDGEDYYKGFDGTAVKLKDGTWVIKRNGITKTYKPNNPNYNEINKKATKNYYKSLRNNQIIENAPSD